jgi:hypothetical protein
MSRILSQLKELRKQIRIPWRIIYVNKEVMPEEFEKNTIYVHIWI